MFRMVPGRSGSRPRLLCLEGCLLPRASPRIALVGVFVYWRWMSETVAGIDPGRVTRWFEENVGGLRPPLRFSLITGGHSNLTYRVDDAGGRCFVLRRPPLGAIVATAHDMGREHRII